MAGSRLIEAVIHGDKGYLCGFVAEAAMGKSVFEQTKDILAQIDETLSKAGTDKTKLIKVNIWLTTLQMVFALNSFFRMIAINKL